MLIKRVPCVPTCTICTWCFVCMLQLRYENVVKQTLDKAEADAKWFCTHVCEKIMFSESWKLCHAYSCKCSVFIFKMLLQVETFGWPAMLCTRAIYFQFWSLTFYSAECPFLLKLSHEVQAYWLPLIASTCFKKARNCRQSNSFWNKPFVSYGSCCPASFCIKLSHYQCNACEHFESCGMGE